MSFAIGAGHRYQNASTTKKINVQFCWWNIYKDNIKRDNNVFNLINKNNDFIFFLKKLSNNGFV